VDGVDVEETQVLGAVQDSLEAVWGELVGEIDQGSGRGGQRQAIDVGDVLRLECPGLVDPDAFLEQLRRSVMTSTAPLGIGIRSPGTAAPRKPSSEALGPPQASTAAHNRARGVSRVCPTGYTPRW
jgi:hypothetical protein